MNDDREIPIEVNSRHEPVSDRMREYATEKAAKLFRFHNRISRVQIVIDGVHEEPSVEMIVHVDSGRTLVAKEHQEHFKGAIDLLVDKMERQLKRDNEKRKSHHGNGKGPRPAGTGGPPGSEPEDTYDDVVRRDLT